VKLPRDLSGEQLAKHLGRVGYQVTRQSGSHIRLTIDKPVQQHITIPAHDNLKIGTLSAILGEVATHLRLTREELLDRLFG
jgi:predicted RNA binding protein YcfA (HicA-like mRNA interferase family)